MALRPHLLRRQLQVGAQCRQQAGHVVVGNGNAFGNPGGARRVDQVGDLLGSRRRQARARAAQDARIVDIDDRQVTAVEPVDQPCGGDRRDRSGIGNHELHSRRRVRRIDRQIGRPGLEHRHYRHDRPGRPWQQQRHTLSRAGAQGGQQVRQPVRRLVELPVGHRPAFKSDRRGLRRARRLGGEHRRNRRRGWHRPGQHRPVTDLVQVCALSGIQDIH